MNLMFAICTGLILLATYILCFIFLKKNLLVVGVITLTIFWSSLGILVFNYMTNTQFRTTINLKFNNISEHKILGKNTLLPLPKKTVFIYRFSEDGATYFTSSSIDNVIDFYRIKSYKDSLKELHENNNIIIKFIYKDLPYSILIEKGENPKGYYLKINP